jgi:transcriptional regulator with XRE-family HTH domain
MSNGKTQRKRAIDYKCPIISRYIDIRRIEKGFTVLEFSKAIGLNKDSYRRRLEGKDGFSDLELSRACDELGMTLSIREVLYASVGVEQEVVKKSGSGRVNGFIKK